MVFTLLQQTAFFEDNDQMGLSNRTRVFLQNEGIQHPRDLADFAKDEHWSQIIENCKRPPQIPDPAPGAAAGAMINQSPFRLPSKSLLRLKVAALVVEYFSRRGRDLTAANMTWIRLDNFCVGFDTLNDRKKKNDELSLPVISTKLSITAFFKAYETYVGKFIG